MDDCVFCKVVKGEIPSHKIWEDDFSIAILDVFPSRKGQILLIPKEHLAPYLFEIEDDKYTKLMLNAKKIANVIDKCLKPIKTGLIVEGLELDHVHVKLYPLDKEFGIPLLEPKLSEEEMKDIAYKIKKCL